MLVEMQKICNWSASKVISQGPEEILLYLSKEEGGLLPASRPTDEKNSAKFARDLTIYKIFIIFLVVGILLTSQGGHCDVITGPASESCHKSLIALDDWFLPGAYQLVFSKQIRKQLPKVPQNIRDNFITWLEQLQNHGLLEIRKRPGLHDEPVINCPGYRSIRLNRGWRAFYRILNLQDGTIELMEINKHDYRAC